RAAAAASAGPMPAGSGGGSSSAPAPFPHGGDPALNEQEKELKRRLKRLYPAVDEQETLLPRSWSPKDKFSYIGLSQNNLRSRNTWFTAQSFNPVNYTNPICIYGVL
uniref:Uncharacterized protein n=1 Tax=Podarcis muralis TaxID=64176 RepID=A0A670IX10_PODMU